MKHQLFETPPNGRTRVIGRGLSMFGMAMAQAVLLSLGAAVTTVQAEDAASDDQGAQVLTRGPIHEAFAGIVSYNPQPGVIVEKAPPEAIEELPPEERPVGDNISWIPGYWGWDDERSDYLWISGTWRVLPPGRQWTTGYWGSSGQSYQWISGYWADSSVREITYLPKPPVTVEAGPNTEAPSRNHAWTPGSWMWQQERYAWRPGYWAEGRSDWDWIPANYVWTPRGYIFVDGYWDYSFDRRGVLYAPVYFQSGHYSRPGYSYSPVVAIGLVAMMEHLFLRPNYHHYYFGDYYDRSYRNTGYYSPYTYHSSRYGYDPVYSYRRWTHREDQDWERRYEASYDYRRDHDSARPPHTWADQKRLRLDTAESREQQQMMAFPLSQMSKQRDGLMRIERVSAEERQRFAKTSREVRNIREQRRTLEVEGVDTARGKTEREIKPTKVKMPASSIVGKAPDRFSKKQAPPKPQRSAITEPGKEPPDRKPDPEKSLTETKTQQQPRDSETKKGQPDSRRDAVPDNPKQPPQPEQRADKPTRQEPQVKEPKLDPRQEPQVKEPKLDPRQEPQVKEPKREPRREPQVQEPKREPRQEPQAQGPKPQPRQEPQAQKPKREPRQEPQIQEPKREPRQEPKAQEPKPQPRQIPQVKEPKHETHDTARQPARTEEAAKPNTPKKSGPDKGDSDQSSGKDRKKERN